MLAQVDVSQFNDSSLPVLVRVSVWRRWRRRLLLAGGSLLVLYGLFLALGFVPINCGYHPPADDYVVIYVQSNDVHTDLVLPVHERGIDWRRLFPPQHFRAGPSRAKFVTFGWGNRDFYIDTPTWADFRLSTACGALFWPSESVLHVDYLADAGQSLGLREVRLTEQQYQRLAEFVRATVGSVDDQGRAVLAAETSYGPTDRFYQSTGRYHCFNTCNQWTGRGLAQAGVPVGIWTPLRPQVLLWLPTPKTAPQPGASLPAGN